MGDRAQHDAEISTNHHKIYKITFPKSAQLCLKVFTFNAQEGKKIDFYRDHFQGVKEWMRMRLSGRSLLQALEKIEVNFKETKQKSKEKQKELMSMHVQTQFLPFPTLYAHYEGQVNNGASVQPEKIDFYLYYTEELFELILRGGSIPNFLYTPKNIFFHRPQSLYGVQSGTFVVNYLSTVGLDLLFLGESIALTDLEEIFPLLPTNLKELMKNPTTYQRQLNRIIKMKGLAWNLLCFFIKDVPNIIIREQLNSQVKVTLQNIFSLLQKHQQQPAMFELLDYHKEQLQQMTKQSGVDYCTFFINILVNNCRDVTWDSIYKDLFLSHLLAEKTKKYNAEMGKAVSKLIRKDISTTKEKVSQEILRELWKHDKQKEQVRHFYEDRCIAGGSMVYFLIRTNVNFHSMMSHLNVLEFIDNTCFCDDLIKVHLNFIESSIQALPDLKNYKIPYSGIPAPNNIKKTEEGRVYNHLTRPQEMVSGLHRQLGKERSFKVQHFSVTMMNQLQYSLFHCD